MEGCSKNGETCPKLLNLIPNQREWLVKRDGEERSHGSSEEKKLELRLGPPGQQDWPLKNSTTRNKNNKERQDQSLLSLGFFSSTNQNQTQNVSTTTPTAKNTSLFLQFSSSPAPGMSVMEKELSHSQQVACNSNIGDLQNAEKKKVFSANTAPLPNISQKRTAPGPVVGWPPIRSFRKNLASTSSSSKQATESPNGDHNKTSTEKPAPVPEPNRKGLFVKINMDGVPIGRKVDLKAYDSYEKLSTAVDELFRGLLAAQRDSSGGGIIKNQEEEKAITGLLDGNGEYVLVYEDNEGDRMLVGDVPWHMFVSTVKRLRVLKSSEFVALTVKQDKVLS